MLGRFTKWGGGPHWRWDGRFLGEDEFGLWWWAPAGTECVRPGAAFTEDVPWVSMTPHEGAWAASFYPDPKRVRIYVDMTTRPVWRRVPATDLVEGVEGVDGVDGVDAGASVWEVTMDDLDLDVVLTRDGDLFVDDEDEFIEHQVELGYPAEVVVLAEQARDDVFAAIAGGREPFASAGFTWLSRAIEQPAGP